MFQDLSRSAKMLAVKHFGSMGMPKCNDFGWDDYKVKIRPLGWRSILRFWPYFSGSNVSFKTTLKTKSKNKQNITLQQVVNRFDGQKMNHNVCPPYEYRRPPTNNIEHIFREYLVTTGEYTIQIALYDNAKGKGTDWEVIANFSILERDKYVPTIVFSLVSLIIGAGLTLLVRSLID